MAFTAYSAINKSLGFSESLIAPETIFLGSPILSTTTTESTNVWSILAGRLGKATKLSVMAIT